MVNVDEIIFRKLMLGMNSACHIAWMYLACLSRPGIIWPDCMSHPHLYLERGAECLEHSDYFVDLLTQIHLKYVLYNRCITHNY